MQQLANTHRDQVIDLLMERMTFERAAVRLYDSILMKLQSSDDPFATGPFAKGLMEPMELYRDQEYEHAQWLEAQIGALGGDVDAMTEKAALIATESKGILEIVLNSDMSISHMFHALLTAELIDNTGWEVLLELADDADDEAARVDFRKRLHQEQDHLDFARRTVIAFARNLVLDQQLPLPKAA
jgi:bacterioferritin (cytochrome b1)